VHCFHETQKFAISFSISAIELVIVQERVGYDEVRDRVLGMSPKPKIQARSIQAQWQGRYSSGPLRPFGTRLSNPGGTIWHFPVFALMTAIERLVAILTSHYHTSAIAKWTEVVNIFIYYPFKAFSYICHRERLSL
jgi:hypothetical protein